MVKETNLNKEPVWNEKIDLSLSLQDLQFIYDCVGAVPIGYLQEKHMKTQYLFSVANSCSLTNLYEELEEVLDRHNGVVDTGDFDKELVISKL